MPAPRVRADYEQLDVIAARFADHAERAQRSMQGIVRQLEALRGGDWIGRGATAFYREMDGEVLPSLRRLASALETARRTTLEISRVMKQAEDEAASVFRLTVGGGLLGALGSVAGFIGDFFAGAGAELWDMVKGIGTLIAHPVDTAKGLWYGVTHPGEFWEAFKQPYVEDWNNGHPGRAIGRGVLFIGSLVVGTKGADKLLKGARAATSAAAADRVVQAAGTASKARILAEALTTRSVRTAFKGAWRESYVAELTGGRVANKIIKVAGVGKTDIDVISRVGEFIMVGGPGKGASAGALRDLAKEITKVRAAAQEAGVTAQYHFARGTSEAALKVAREMLGPENVRVFRVLTPELAGAAGVAGDVVGNASEAYELGGQP